MGQIELKPFLELMRRASKCKYKTVFMVNHLLMQCYSVDIDSDIGFHYVLPIPTDNPAYQYSFYDALLELAPSDILKTYTEGHKTLQEYKKENNIKPKELQEDLFVQFKESGCELKFVFYASDKLIDTQIYTTEYPIDQTRPEVENCLKTLEALIDRIKPGGACVLLDGLRLGIFDRALQSADVYFHIIKINGVKIRVPFIKSMFLGSKSFDQFIVSVQETKINNIYLYCISLTRKGLTDLFYGYLQNY